MVLGRSTHRRGSSAAHPRQQLPRQAAAPTPPNLRRGRTSAHPRRQSPRPQQPQAQAIATKGAPQRTLDTNYSAQQLQPATQPPPRVQSHAPSMPITPPTTAPNRANHRRGSSIAHPRRQLPPITTPKAGATSTEGATSRTLDANHPARNSPNTTQPPPREHHSAPSTAITPLKAVPNKGNRHRGSTAAHPRR